MQGQDCLSFHALDRHRPHAGPRDRFANCPCVIAVAFTVLAQTRPTSVAGRAPLPELARPLVRLGACLHTDDARRQPRYEQHQLAAADCPAYEHIVAHDRLLSTPLPTDSWLDSCRSACLNTGIAHITTI